MKRPPFQRSTVVLYWNKELFKEAGLDPNKPPANWAEMLDYAKKLTKKDAGGKVTQWGIQVPSSGFPYWLFQGLAIQNGVALANPGKALLLFGVRRYKIGREVEDALNLLLATQGLDKKILNANTILVYPRRPDKEREYRELAVRTFYLSHGDPKVIAAEINVTVSLARVTSMPIEAAASSSSLMACSARRLAFSTGSSALTMTSSKKLSTGARSAASACNDSL